MKDLKQKMAASWQDKAEINAYHWVDSESEQWEKQAYYQKGKELTKELFVDFLIGQGLDENKLKRFLALDIGCGTGRLVRGLSSYFEKVIGVDISKKMLELAREDNKDLENVEFRLIDGLSLKNFRDESFDFICSFIVFQHIPSKKTIIKYMEEIRRLLRPGSFAKFQVRGCPGKLPLSLPAWRYIGFNSFYLALSEKRGLPYPVVRSYDTVYGAFFKERELKEILKQIGFSRIKVFCDKKEKKYLWAEVQK